MATARLTAYGATAKGSGYANADAACSTNTGGTQLLATDDSAVYAYAEADEADEKIYLAKIATVEDPSHLYQDGDGYAAGQKVYVPEQTIGGIFGTITTAGYYTVALDGDIDNAAYITIFAEDEVVTQPTECGTTYTYGADEGANKVTDPEGCEGCKGGGPLINRFVNINTNYGKNDDEGIDQVPFSLQTAGPFSLKRRGAYKASRGDPSDEV